MARVSFLSKRRQMGLSKHPKHRVACHFLSQRRLKQHCDQFFCCAVALSTQVVKLPKSGERNQPPFTSSPLVCTFNLKSALITAVCSRNSRRSRAAGASRSRTTISSRKIFAGLGICPSFSEFMPPFLHPLVDKHFPSTGEYDPIVWVTACQVCTQHGIRPALEPLMAGGRCI